MRITLHRSAQVEIAEAAQFYETRVPGLGRRFLDEIDRGLHQVTAYPKLWPVIEADVRRFLLAGFPYALIYHLRPDEIHVVSCKHHRRNPNSWRGRIE